MKNPAAVALGALGGKAGTGAAKRRSPEHYKKTGEYGKQYWLDVKAGKRPAPKKKPKDDGLLRVAIP